MKAKTYSVVGFAMVPWECAIEVEAVSADEAMQKARTVFRREGKNCLVGNGFDTSSVHSFEPTEANSKT
jgi:hypothetical protein